MFYVKAIDKFDKAQKMFVEETLEAAKEIAATLEKNFIVKVFKIDEVEKFVVEEGYHYCEDPSYSCDDEGCEESWDKSIAYLDEEPSQDFLFALASRMFEIKRKRYEGREDVRVDIETTGFGSYVVSCYGKGWDCTHSYGVTKSSIILEKEVIIK